MSHVPQRKEKDCLNCGAMVQGRFCHVCGQENVVPKETFWHMVTHFFYDITHFDSSFFHTVHHLILRPGFLSKEYMAGRRASYLHPVRMYVFTSAIFFLLFFSIFKPATNVKTNANTPVSAKERAEYIDKLQKRLEKDSGNAQFREKLMWARDTTRPLLVKDILDMEESQINFINVDFKTIAAYDSAQKTLPKSKRDGWFTRRMKKKQIDINERIRENPDEALKEFAESLLHRLPYMLFVSLPLFALILKLVYVRRKQFYYADHGVFTIHLYVFTFLVLLAIFALGALADAIHVSDIEWLMGALFLLLYFYLYKAMRNFYGQRRAKTFFKFLFVAFSSLIMMLVLFLLFMFFSAITL